MSEEKRTVIPRGVKQRCDTCGHPTANLTETDDTRKLCEDCAAEELGCEDEEESDG
jgi:hypothetical protein